MRRLTYLEGFRSAVRRYPESVAVVAADGRGVTYAELDERTDALAAALDARLGAGRCAGLAENRLATVELMLASIKRGRASVQLPTRGAVGELAAMTETARGRGLLYDSVTAEKAAELVERVGFDALVGVGDVADPLDGAEVYEDVVAGADPADAPDEPATDPGEYAVHFTSGTTGDPKAVLSDQEQTWLAANQPTLEMSLTASDRALVCTPWYHGVTCFTWVLAHLLVGGTLVLQRAFEPPESLRLMEDHAVTGLLAVPTQLEALLRAQDDVGADLSALSYVRTGGAVVPKSLIERVREHFSDGVFNTYGQTEAVINLSFAYPHEQDDHPGSIGKGTFCWELRAVEPADPPAKPDPEATVGAGEVGEILARGPRMIDGYLDRPELSETIFVEGGGGPDDRWLRTEDVARVDEGGHLVVIDRVDNMLVSGGENIYPEEVQRALKDHPGVIDAGVVGLPDEEWGQVVAAAVATDGDVNEEELDEHCRDHDTLASFKRPRRYVFVDEVPRTATGTLVRGEVEAMFEAA
ncbi:MAG TPA: AMP-binding protein [Halobacteriales archaeon]|nr:AMP-binding protein [Halobacteriales archaeon]